MTGDEALARWKRVTDAAVERITHSSDDTAAGPDERAAVDLERWRQLLPVTAPVTAARVNT